VKLSEALYVVEKKARDVVEMRSKIQKELMLKEKEKKE
jgi:SNW domain-containing protein 1